MIQSTLHFFFNGRSSEEFGIINVNRGTGLFQEHFLSEREIIEFELEWTDTPLFQRIKKKPLVIPVRLFFSEGFDDESLLEIQSWLDVDYYKPLQFDDDLKKIYYAIPIGEPSITHNGNGEGYIDIVFRCNSPYSYSPIMETNLYKCSDELEFEIINYGAEIVYPTIYIKKIDNGNVSILDINNEDLLMINNLYDQEKIEIDCEFEEIFSSLDIPRYDDHNDIFLKLNIGVNKFKIIGSCEIYFKYQFKFKS